MNKHKIFANAIKEIEYLKAHFTNEEKQNLIYRKKYFDAEKPKLCIYGLATGICNSERAKKLYKKSLTFEGVVNLGIFAPISNIIYNAFTPMEIILFKMTKRQGIKVINYICGTNKFHGIDENLINATIEKWNKALERRNKGK